MSHSDHIFGLSPSFCSLTSLDLASTSATLGSPTETHSLSGPFSTHLAELTVLHMFIAIVGTRFAGKSAVHEYLVSQGFVSLHLCEGANPEVCLVISSSLVMFLTNSG